jgi:hypothetical protein
MVGKKVRILHNGEPVQAMIVRNNYQTSPYILVNLETGNAISGSSRIPALYKDVVDINKLLVRLVLSGEDFEVSIQDTTLNIYVDDELTETHSHLTFEELFDIDILIKMFDIPKRAV